MSPRPARSAQAGRRIRATALLAALLLVLLVAFLLLSGGRARRMPSAGPPAHGASAAEQFGVNVNRLFDDQTYSPAAIDAQLQALQRTGAGLARSDALWEATEPSAPVAGMHRYVWAFDDAVAGALAAHGLRWLAIVDYSAPWAQSLPGREHSPPDSAGDYAAFAAAFAARYGRGGSFWSAHPALPAEPVDTYEIWNEPDNPHFWVPAPDAGRYAELYLAARDAIKAVDPAAQVIIGGLGAPERFLPAMTLARPALRGHVDGVAVHPYRHTPDQVLSAVRSYRSVMNSLGMSRVPIYVTEVGWATLPAGGRFWAPERLRAGYITQTLTMLAHSGCGIADILWYTWVTPERNSSTDEDWYGIHPPRGQSTSPDTDAFAAGLGKARAPAPEPERCGSG